MSHCESLDSTRVSRPIAAIAWSLVFACLPLGDAVLRAQETEMLDWLEDYDAAIAEARHTGKPILLEFRCAP